MIDDKLKSLNSHRAKLPDSVWIAGFLDKVTEKINRQEVLNVREGTEIERLYNRYIKGVYEP